MNFDFRNNKYCSTYNILVPAWAETLFENEDQAKRAIDREGNVSVNYLISKVYSL